MGPERGGHTVRVMSPNSEPPEKAGVAGGVCARGKSSRKSKQCQSGLESSTMLSRQRCEPTSRRNSGQQRFTAPISSLYCELRAAPLPRFPRLALTAKRSGVNRLQSPPEVTKLSDFKGDNVRAQRPSPGPAISFPGEITYSCGLSLGCAYTKWV